MDEPTTSTPGAGPSAGPSGPAGPGTTYAEGPRVSGEQMRDVSRLRRSRSDRYVAGVAGGLGRHFDVDPTVVRVVLVVLAFFGGAGILVYAAVWCFVPEDGASRAPLEVGGEARRAILIAAAAIAALIVFGSPFFDGGWGGGVPIPLLLVGLVVVAVVATRRHRGDSPAGPPAPWGADVTPRPSPEGTPVSTTDTWQQPTPAGTSSAPTTTDPGPDPTRRFDQQPPSWMPPPVAAYTPPPRPRRTGPVLFWPTVALILIALGTLGIVDVSSDVPVSAYAATALGITALALVLGAFVGRPGGLIALGLVGVIGLGATSAVDAATDGSLRDDSVTFFPASASDVRSTYSIDTGDLTVDLSGVDDVAALDGTTIDVRAKAGEIRVVLPPGVVADVSASMRYAGQIDIGGAVRGGYHFADRRTLGTATGDAPAIDLDLSARVGQITVEQR